MSEVARLRMELKADMELLAIRQGDMAGEVEQITTRLQDGLQDVSEQVQTVAEQVQVVAEQVQVVARQVQVVADTTSTEITRLGREFAEGSRWMQGRLRLLGQRFDAVLGAVERDYLDDRELLYDLRDRVARLEGERPPAA